MLLPRADTRTELSMGNAGAGRVVRRGTPRGHCSTRRSDLRRKERTLVHLELHESAEIEPLEMGLSEPRDGMVEIETVDETGDPLDFHGAPRKRKPHEPEPVGATGQNFEG